MASLLARNRPAKCAVVLPLCTLLSRFEGDDAGARHRSVDRSVLNRWVLKYAPDVDKRIRHHLQPTNDS